MQELVDLKQSDWNLQKKKLTNEWAISSGTLRARVTRLHQKMDRLVKASYPQVVD